MNSSLRIFSLLSTLAVLASCATPTPFIEKGIPKYTIVGKKGETQSSRFRGNSSTSFTRTSLFSRMAAIVECDQQNKLALIFGTTDDSSSFTHLQTTTQTTPVWTRRGSFYISHTQTQPVTTTYPAHISLFHCTEKFLTFDNSEDIEFEAVKKELVHMFTGDFKGGILIKKPGSNKTFFESDLIVNVNDKRVETTVDLWIALSASPHLKAQLTIYRNRKPLKINLSLKDETDDLKMANAKLVSSACAEILKDHDTVPPLCADKKDTPQTEPLAPVDESQLSNKQLKRRMEKENKL